LRLEVFVTNGQISIKLGTKHYYLKFLKRKTRSGPSSRDMVIELCILVVANIFFSA
jgi:hypothetical protein